MYYSFLLYARAALALTKKKPKKTNVHLEMRKLKHKELHRLKNRGEKG